MLKMFKFLIIIKIIAKIDKNTKINSSVRFVSFEPIFIYFHPLKIAYITPKGSKVNTKQLKYQASDILPLNKARNIRLIPHPGHFKPVIVRKTQGICTP